MTELSLLIAVLSLLVTLLIALDQKRQALTLDMSNRYQTLKLELLDKVFDEQMNIRLSKEKTVEYITLYFDLCSEEFRLHTDWWLTRKIKQYDWQMFSEGIVKEVKEHPVFKEVWRELQKNKYYTEERFVEYINGILKDD